MLRARLAGGAGRLTDWLVTSYTHQGFADEAVHVLQQWQFEPSRINGEPVDTVANITYQFDVRAVCGSARSGRS